MNCQEIQLTEVIKDIAAGPFGSNLKVSCFVNEGFPIVDGANLKRFKVTDNITKFVTEEKARSLHRSIAKRGDVVVTISGTLGQIAYIPNDSKYEEYLCSQRQFRVTFDTTKVYVPYLVFYFHTYEGQHKILSFANQVGVPALSQPLKNFRQITVQLPDIKTQKKIANIVEVLNGKIEENENINNNLEEQLSALFINMFGHSIDSLDNSDIKLGDLIESVDNRGKTPPLSDEPTDYPIIDVRALSGNSRIIDYTNCTKYVSKETYNNWFRSGHPKEYDILISTVGSLAEMKIFLGTIGCIAQNVVGFRTKGISPLYLYQYLNYIKNDLVAYNIGSVQPSIKVTHIIKHSIYVASKEDIEIFDSIARNITKKIFANCQENEALKQMRDTLLPKLMSGELDVSNIKI